METVKRHSLKVEEVRRKLARAQTTGKAGDATVKLSGRGAVEVDLGDVGLSGPEKLKVEKNVAEAFDLALEKQRRRVEKEIDEIS